MCGTQGAMIVASTLQIVLGFSGFWRNVVRFLTHLSAVPLVALLGFGLFEYGFPVLADCVEIGLPELIIPVVFSQNTCRIDHAGIISGAPWISIPYPFQLGALTFDAGEAFTMMTASFVALVESTGTFIVVSRYASATPLPPSVLSRGVGWQQDMYIELDVREEYTSPMLQLLN
ncbi:hypothetical protein RIF29_04206 [Crotalaria pallida]|uniref:Uncharacterized protein n=1 Tax=Crotalaria pallida TaxID=3830 RepID=A0AAN9P938_CROPI